MKPVRNYWSDRGFRGGALLAAAAGLACVCGFPPAMAQPVVQQTPAGSSLNAALNRLARNPRDLAALIDAGKAALMMGDVDAAVGFFARADQLSPDNMQVKAGLAGALVRSENPYDAIPLFTEAERGGGLDPLLMSERGLAYDLVGDTATAQKYYRQSLASSSSDETRRRLALSQAIAGDRTGMEATLSPLLQRQDKAAWRTRAFSLAILGKPEEAVAIANQTMPTELANGIAPYLRYMPKLTPAQQAAAATFGRFPRASEIGHDDPRVALYAPPRRAQTADAGLVPAGKPLGTRTASRDERRKSRERDRDAARLAVATVSGSAQAARSAPPEPVPTRQGTGASASPAASQPARGVPLAQAAAPAPSSSPFQAAAPAYATRPAATQVVAPNASGASAALAAPVRSAAAVQPGSGPVSASTLAASTPPRTGVAMNSPSGSSGLAQISRAQAAPVLVGPPAPAASDAALSSGASSTSAQARASSSPVPVPAPTAATPAPAPAKQAPAAKPLRVADAFADLSLPTGPAAPPPGAVDVRKIKPKAKPAEVVKEPPKPAHPSRIWVQVGTGRDEGALGFTWRTLARQNAEVFKGRSASLSEWGRTNRLLTGPFPTEAAATAFLGKLKKAGVDAFVWTSPAGQVVDAL